MDMRPFALAAAALVAGCMPSAPWVQAERDFQSSDDQFRIQLPDGWMRVNVDETLLITRDGLDLQRIQVARHELGKPLKNSKRAPRAGMEPAEIADLLSGEFSSGEGITGVKVLESSPASLSGARGFKLVVAFKDQDGLRRRAVIYGLVGQKALWLAAYQAPQRHYFDQDLATFEKAVKTLRLAAAELPKA
jgi:hypothetical protein